MLNHHIYHFTFYKDEFLHWFTFQPFLYDFVLQAPIFSTSSGLQVQSQIDIGTQFTIDGNGIFLCAFLPKMPDQMLDKLHPEPNLHYPVDSTALLQYAVHKV